MSSTALTQKRRRSSWISSYSELSISDAEERLGFEMESLGKNPIAITELVATANNRVGGATINSMKEKVYSNILDYLGFEGYPSTLTKDFCEANVSDLVLLMLNPILSDFRSKTGRDLRLRREKKIVAVDGLTGGKEEFVVVDVVEVFERNFVLIIERKKDSGDDGMKQCLLSMKDIWDNNGAGEVYGFVTTGVYWRMLRYNGKAFQVTDVVQALFLAMTNQKDLWLEMYSALVECIIVALNDGGVVMKNVVE